MNNRKYNDKSTPYMEIKEERILCASIWYQDNKVYQQQPVNIESGYVLSGYRHGDCLSNLFVFDNYCQKHVEGFLTNLNRFVNRIEGAQIAYKAKQIDKPLGSLISENLW